MPLLGNFIVWFWNADSDNSHPPKQAVVIRYWKSCNSLSVFMTRLWACVKMLKHCKEGCTYTTSSNTLKWLIVFSKLQKDCELLAINFFAISCFCYLMLLRTTPFVHFMMRRQLHSFNAPISVECSEYNSILLQLNDINTFICARDETLSQQHNV